MSTCRFSKAVSAIKRPVKDTPKTKSPSTLLLLRDKVKMLEIQKLTWEKEKEMLIKKHNEVLFDLIETKILVICAVIKNYH
jgi:hypothetical protein